MTQSHDITIRKPISLWKRELSFSFKDIFYPLGKAAISGVVLDSKGVMENVFEALKGIAPQDKPAQAAWVLIIKSLSQSLAELTEEYKDFFPEEIEDSKITKLTAALENDLDTIEAGLDADFFDNPHKLALLEDIKPSLVTWLTGLGMTEPQAIALHLRLKSHFALSLHKQWLLDPQEYACIGKAVNSPFLNANKSERAWIQYREWLQEKANERMFAEAFSLSQVYVPLRGYYEIKKTQGNDDIEKHNNEKKERIVVDLHSEMESWLINFNPDNALRVISGGPGSGKSSFAKMFAAYVSREKKEINVIFIPLHQFDPSEDLYTALDLFIKEDRFLDTNPLSEKKERLFFIFDGLDELSMQGRAAAETARFFVDEVRSKINKYNGQKFQYQALITGRDVAIQSASGYLREQGQILRVLPYYVSDEEAEEYTDENNLLKEDQRNQWWQNYGAAKNLLYKGLPNELNTDNLTPITKEPLLNYLVALSLEHGVEFSDKTTLNEIYNELLEAVHKRQWDHGTHKGTQHLSIDQFTRVLEEIALCVWHGDGRTATVKQIYNQCHNSKLTCLLEEFQEGAEKGVSRLLTAFYFRQSDKMQEGEKTFEFTHKSFGEYLTAKRIVRTVSLLHDAINEAGRP